MSQGQSFVMPTAAARPVYVAFVIRFWLKRAHGRVPPARHDAMDCGSREDHLLCNAAANRAIRGSQIHRMTCFELPLAVRTFVIVCWHLALPPIEQRNFSRHHGMDASVTGVHASGRDSWTQLQRAGCLPLTPNAAEVTSVLDRFSASRVGALNRRVSTSQTQPLTTTSFGMRG